MSTDAIVPESTVAIIVGASTFPYCPSLAESKSFENSAADFREYLLQHIGGFGLSKANVLDLFNTHRSPTEIDRDISDFLKRRKETIRDVLFYYVGHGGFTGFNNDYYLALWSTNDSNPGISSLRVVDLARRLNADARHVRRFIILDSCFSAAAYREFQSPPLEIARTKTIEAFPNRGTALLCSSGPRYLSRAPENQRNTMFSAALLQALKSGNPAIPHAISFEEIAAQVKDLLNSTTRTMRSDQKCMLLSSGKGIFPNFPFSQTGPLL